MRIYDREGKRLLSQITLYLSPDEAAELASSAQMLADDPGKHHEHVPAQDFQTEITVAVCTDENLAHFDSESRAVIQGTADVIQPR